MATAPGVLDEDAATEGRDDTAFDGGAVSGIRVHGLFVQLVKDGLC
jgi:hypothetical protein